MAIDITSPAYKANPWPACAHARAEGPVVRVPLPNMHIPGGAQDAYLVTRYEDAIAVLKDERFVKDVRSARPRAERGQPWIPKSLKPLGRNMLDLDGADHRRLRNLVRDTFTPRYIAQLEPRVQALADELLDGMAAAGRADLVADYALILPLTVIAEIMGVSPRDRMRFRRWVSRLFLTSNAARPQLAMLLMLPSALAMMRFLRRLIAERRARPRDDLVSRLAAMEEDGDRLDEDELLAMVAILLIAGYETTVNLIATGTLLLLTHPDQLARLRADPDLIGSSVEELLRLATPVDVATERYASADLEVGGVTIPRGALVLVGIASANADEAHFARPECLDVGRAENRHLAFGQGPHYCLGAPLARLEGRIALGSLVRRFPDLRLDSPPERLQWRPGLTLRGLQSLPVRL
ncbi:MAG TPA: cytochrome P450 [Candidatus Dormibacteraeota bacterium]|nr:cytochrome P450 [Candidatus Dormibacteraeota bacterium]